MYFKFVVLGNVSFVSEAKGFLNGAQAEITTSRGRRRNTIAERNWPGFFDGATGLFLSYEIGARKPNAEIYRHLLDDLGVKGEQCLFIDDLERNVEAARAAGIQAHQFIPANHAAIRQAVGEFSGFA